MRLGIQLTLHFEILWETIYWVEKYETISPHHDFFFSFYIKFLKKIHPFLICNSPYSVRLWYFYSRYLSFVFLQDTLGIHYDDHGFYKELIDLIKAKTWRMNELVILTIYLPKVIKDVIEVLAIDILPPFSNRSNSHIEEFMTSALQKMANSNLVNFLFGLKSRFNQGFGSKTRERKNNDIKDHSFDVASALLLVVMFSC